MKGSAFAVDSTLASSLSGMQIVVFHLLGLLLELSMLVPLPVLEPSTMAD